MMQRKVALCALLWERPMLRFGKQHIAHGRASILMSVEVERKFVCDVDIQKTLGEIGAVCIGQRQFKDQYFDTPDFRLTLRDVWLRQRKGCWELKCPTAEIAQAENGGGQAKEAALCSRYKEITDLPQIQRKVKEVIKDSLGDGKTVEEEGCENQKKPPVNQDRPETGEKGSSGEEDSWLRELNLVCFAEFTTVRCSFTLEGGVRVDLDQADFGYCVGEIEVLVPEGEDVKSALESIGKTAQKLGLTGDQRVQGKMDVYLQRYCPEHYSKLLTAHIL